MLEDEKKFKIKKQEEYAKLCKDHLEESTDYAIFASLTGIISLINFLLWGTNLIDPLLFKEIIDKISIFEMPQSFYGWSGLFNALLSAILNNLSKQSAINRKVYLEKLLEYKDSLEYLNQLAEENKENEVGVEERPLKQTFAELEREISLDDYSDIGKNLHR